MAPVQLRQQRRDIESQWARWQTGSDDLVVRDDVAGSWQRCSGVVSLDVTAAPSDSDFGVSFDWNEHPLNGPVTALAEDLTQLAVDGGFVVAITNANSTIVWTAGSAHMRDRAARANFAEGAKWDELSVGTNALDLAQRTGRPQTVFSAEHFAPLVHKWVCYAAPITDPRTGQSLGVIDFSTTWENANPLALRTVTAIASGISAELLRLSPAAAGVRFNFLGKKPTAWLDGEPIALTRRQFEICALLSMHPNGLSLDELHLALYGDAKVSYSTLKSEISTLRALLGGTISSRPYLLSGQFSSDVERMVASLNRGDFVSAMAEYAGRLLPSSESPLIGDLRNWIDVSVREACLRSHDFRSVASFLDLHQYDLEVAQHLASITAESDPRYSVVKAGLLRAQSVD